MTPEQKRIAIAEACGFTGINTQAPLWFSQDDGRFIPDYLNDLNAMHEAVMRLTPSQQFQYHQWLDEVTEPEGKAKFAQWPILRMTNATAAQRAEAFLKTIGKWEDE